MAATSVILDIRANTNRALNEFKRFSAQLDNKFLISGLKLDVVRSALGQINREFQRAIGEQGLTSGQSLRAAQNQAALMLDTFKNVGIESSIAITEQFSNAFSEIAIRAGGSSEDIKKALGATSWISTNLAQDLRDQLAKGVMEFQIYAKQAGLGDNYAEIIQRFLAGQVSAGELIESGGALEKSIGVSLSRISGTPALLANAEQRSRVIAEFQNPENLRMLEEMIARADWGFTIIQKLNASLFNPEKGVFGVLRQVTMAVGDKTTILQETRALIDSIFGQQGLFVTFFEQVGKIFGIEDPLKVVIKGVRWITRQFNELNEFLQSPEMQAIVGILQNAFNTVKDFVTKIYEATKTDLENPDSLINQIGAGVSRFFTGIHETIKSGDWDPTTINTNIKEIGKDIREFIRKIGKSFRDIDISKQGTFILETVGTLVEEVTKTLARLIREGLETLFSEKGQMAFAGILDVINRGLRGFFSELFGDGPGSVLAKIGTVGIAAAFGKKLLAGIVGFGALLIGALPGGQLINQFIRTRIRTALNALGTAISNAIRTVPGFRQTANIISPGLGTGGAPASELGFEREMLMHVRRIASCVCRNIPTSPRPSLPPSTPTSRPSPAPVPIDPITRKPIPRLTTPAPPPTPWPYLGPRPAPLPPPSPVPTPVSRFRGGAGVIGKGALLGGGLLAVGAAASANNGSGLTQSGGIFEGAASGAMIGMLFGPKGAIAGAILGGLAAWTGDLAKSGGQVKAVLEPLGKAFNMIKETIGPTFKSLWDVIGSTVGIFTSLFPVFDRFKGETNSTTKIITGLKIILTPVVLAFQLLEQVANVLAIAFKGAELSIARFRLFLSDINPAKNPEENARLRGRVQTLEGELEETLKRPQESLQRHQRQNWGWFDMGTRSLGGPVFDGVAYKVGERGPEVFVPSTNGTIINNMALRTGLGPDTSRTSTTNNLNITVNVNGGLVLDDMEDFERTIVDVINKAWIGATTGVASRGAIV